MEQERLADRIKTRRQELGLMPADLAYACGVSIAAVMQWESGETKSLNSKNLLRLADVLNVTPTWLESGEGEKVASPDRQAFSVALARRDKAASDRARRAWERIAASFAKTALLPTLLLGLAIQPGPAEAASHNVFHGRIAALIHNDRLAWLRRLWNLLCVNARHFLTQNSHFGRAE